MQKDGKKTKPDRPLTSPASTEVAGSSSTSSDYVWCDIEALARAGEYTYFNPPSAFRDSMFAERKKWATDVKLQTVQAIVNAVSNVCMPWWVDWALWRQHASSFLTRLCAHRDRIHHEHYDRQAELQRRLEQLETRQEVLEQALYKITRGFEQGVPASTPFHTAGLEPEPRRGRSPRPDEPLEEAILRAQLAAGAARFPSPSGFLRQLATDGVGDW